MRKVVLILFILLLSASLYGADDASFVRKLALKKAASVSDAVILVAMMQGNQGLDFAKAVSYLQKKAVIKESPVASETLTRGMLAKLIMKAKGFSGGLMYSIFGGGRYAWRELVHRRIMRAQGSENHPVSGGELVAVISRVSGEKPLKLQ